MLNVYNRGGQTAAREPHAALRHVFRGSSRVPRKMSRAGQSAAREMILYFIQPKTTKTEKKKGQRSNNDDENG